MRLGPGVRLCCQLHWNCATSGLPENHSRHDIASHIFGSTTSNAPGLSSANNQQGDFSSPLALIAFAIAFVDPAPAFGMVVIYV
jgi:hypothetical protein